MGRKCLMWKGHNSLHGYGWATSIYMGMDGPQVFAWVWMGHKYLHGCGWARSIYMSLNGL